ncbi:MAG: sugar phosphate isomerase/epimerase [Nitrososphaerales archaeon]|jgi:sugar phosphate isomerase/epimerase
MKLGVSTWSLLDTDLNSAVRAIGDAGFELIELWGEVPHAYHDWTDRKCLKETLSTYDMTLTLHAPFTDLNLATPFQPMKGAVARTLTDFVKFGEQLRASMITFHPGSVQNKALVPQAVENSVAILRELVKESSGRLTICIENQAKSKSRYQFPLASTIESLELMLAQVEGSRFTLDTGHAHVSGHDPLALAERVGSKLAEIHLSDTAGATDDHLIPGEGTASLQGLLDKVSRSDVFLCLELDPDKYTQDQVISAASELKAKLAKGFRLPSPSPC